jgi:hyperosmotically inducible periplasmic protein
MLSVLLTLAASTPGDHRKKNRGIHMLKRLTVAAACAALALTAAGAAAQDKPQEKPKETTIVIKDDATPKAKKAAKKTADATKKAAEKTKDAAKKTADTVKDTKVEVKDDTKVVVKDDTTPAAKKAAAAVTDAEITSAVKTKLLGDKAVAGSNINVDTNHGVVTLTGPVKTAGEKAEALRLARTTKGVSSVVDKLEIR